MAKVVVWDFFKQAQSLLIDREIYGNLDNLNVNPDNPFHPIRKDQLGKRLGETASAEWYQETQ